MNYGTTTCIQKEAGNQLKQRKGVTGMATKGMNNVKKQKGGKICQTLKNSSEYGIVLKVMVCI